MCLFSSTSVRNVALLATSLVTTRTSSNHGLEYMIHPSALEMRTSGSMEDYIVVRRSNNYRVLPFMIKVQLTLGWIYRQEKVDE